MLIKPFLVKPLKTLGFSVLINNLKRGLREMYSAATMLS